VKSAELQELHDDLSQEFSRLKRLVDDLNELGQRLDYSAESVEAAALRPHSFYTGVKRMLLLVSRVMKEEPQAKEKARIAACWSV